MKTFILLIFISFASISSAQSDSKFEIRSVVSYDFIKFSDANMYSRMQLAGKCELGYRISAKWSAGIHGELGIAVNYFAWILPILSISAATGIYLEHHFNESFSVVGTANLNNYNKLGKSFSLGIAPQYLFGKKAKWGVRGTFEYGFGSNRFTSSTVFRIGLVSAISKKK